MHARFFRDGLEADDFVLGFDYCEVQEFRILFYSEGAPTETATLRDSGQWMLTCCPGETFSRFQILG